MSGGGAEMLDEMTPTSKTAKAFKVFAWICLAVGFTILMLEAFLHYRSSFSRTPLPASAWSATAIFMGSMLLLFGAGALQFAVTQRALTVIGYILPIFANAVSSLRFGGQRAGDPKVSQSTAEKPPTAPTVLVAGETREPSKADDESDDSPD